MCVAVLGDVSAIGQWVAQYFLVLQYNVMMNEDKKNMWTSEGMAELGMSFWYVSNRFKLHSSRLKLGFSWLNLI